MRNKIIHLHISMIHGRLFSSLSSRLSRSKPSTETSDTHVAVNNLKQFVPQSKPVGDADTLKLQNFINSHKSIFVLTGAGLSTESGIPDYRSEGVGLYASSTNRPVQYQDFLKSPDIRKRYWARNFVGWPVFSSVQPNASHIAFKNWEVSSKILWLVTQNVDALHTKAGSRKVTELHGCSHRVECLKCAKLYHRNHIQESIKRENDIFNVEPSIHMAPDGDVQLTQERIQSFKTPNCETCGGILKPQVTFFGDNVNRIVVDYVHEKLRESDAVLIAGSSLQVYSGYRFALAASEQKKPIAIVNIGPTRADKLCDLKLNVKCGDILPLITV